MSKNHYVYILTRARNSTFYVGMTTDLIQRIYEHKMELVEGFTKTHQIKTLVYYEQFDDMYQALLREKLIKKWKRRYKINAIESINP